VGRIKTTLIKRASHDLMDKHPTEFKKDFTENKKIVMQHAEVRSKKIRNIIAGYMTRLVKSRN